jgi:hypothetical protein
VNECLPEFAATLKIEVIQACKSMNKTLHRGKKRLLVRRFFCLRAWRNG